LSHFSALEDFTRHGLLRNEDDGPDPLMPFTPKMSVKGIHQGYHLKYIHIICPQVANWPWCCRPVGPHHLTRSVAARTNVQRRTQAFASINMFEWNIMLQDSLSLSGFDNVVRGRLSFKLLPSFDQNNLLFFV